MAIEVNGHSWETDVAKTRRVTGGVLCLRCANCGRGTQVPMRSATKEQYLMKQEPCSKAKPMPSPPAPIVVGPDHPAWRGIDDDDWNGSTFVNWLTTLKGQTVVVQVPQEIDPGLLGRMVTALISAAEGVRIEKSP